MLLLGFLFQASFSSAPQAESPPESPAPIATPAPEPNIDRPGEGIVAVPDPFAASPSSAPPPVSDREAVEAEPPQSPSSSPSRNSYYGHLAYAENSQYLVSVGQFVRESYERTEYLDQEAAMAFLQMQADAQAAGVYMMPISGFRSVADQEALFNRQIERQGSAEAAARLSAPPGHSEHHTGFAIDIADVDQPNTDVKFAFEDTPVYQWLTRNAHLYSFELSFPPSNPQGVSFEPWHWRFIGSARAQQVFRPAMRL